MIPIIYHGADGEKSYNIQDFEKHFLEICNSHKDEKRALAFAFILHDLRDPHISKALDDIHYWNALDDISGKYLSVFSFHTTPPPSTHIPEHEIQQMSIVNLNWSDNRKSLIDKYFNFGRAIKLPAILFFQVSNKKIIGSRLIQLRKRTIEEAFLEIKDILSVAAQAVSAVIEENYTNANEIFQLIDTSLDDRGIIVTASRIVKSLPTIKDILSLFDK